MKIDWQPLARLIDDHKRFVLSSHVRPDADALGSELGLARLLAARGKQVRIINPSASPENLLFLDPDGLVQKFGEGVTAADVQDTDVHIVLDTSAWSQLEDVGDAMRESSARKVVIDHHVSSDDLGAVEFKDTRAEATGALIYRFASAVGWPIDEACATALYSAIATDTGWFRFSSTTGETMRTVGALIDAGAKPDVIYRLLYEQISLARHKLAGRALSRVEVDGDGRLGFTWVNWSDFVETGARPADTEDLVNECLRIAGVQCAFIAVEQMNSRIKFSLRSRSDVNVARIAEQFGGGGHNKAAGAMLPGPLAEAVDSIRSAMLNSLAEPPRVHA